MGVGVKECCLFRCTLSGEKSIENTPLVRPVRVPK
jgi:hypothetical protein